MLCLLCESIWCVIVCLTSHLHLRLNSRNHIRDNSFKLSSIRVGKLSDTYRRQPTQNELTVIVRRSTTSDFNGTNPTTVGYTATVPKLVRYSHLLTISKLIGVYSRRRTRLLSLLRAKIKPRNRALRVGTITAQFKGGCLYIGSKGSIRDRLLPLYHTASLALPTSSCTYVIVSTWHRMHSVSGDITA